jgi:hypothetical protein
MIVAALLVAGCGRTTGPIGASGRHASATPTSAILPGTALTWTAGNLPPGQATADGFDNPLHQDGVAGMVFAPSDGNIAYACGAPASPPGESGMWGTHDRARHWTQLAPLPSATQQFGVCVVIPDAVDPSIVVVAISSTRMGQLFVSPPPLYISYFTQFVTFDGGAHWQLLHGPKPNLLKWLATYHGTTLAMLEDDSGTVHLWSSTDQMQTWHEPPQAPTGRPWINPATGDLLVIGQTGSGAAKISESSDLGQQWSSIPTPADFALATPALVSPSVSGQPWTICGIQSTPSTPYPSGNLLCTLDNGRTWTSRPKLVTTFDNTDKGIVAPQAADVLAVAPDGTIYAEMDPSMWPLGIPDGLYRLTPQASRWQLLGEPPDNTVEFSNIPGAGLLWCAQTPEGPLFAGLFPAAAM